MIAAMDKNRGISLGENIPWKIPEDIDFFKQTTTNSTVIMGSKTYFSLPIKFRPLPNRYNIVLTQNEHLLHIDNFTGPNMTFEELDKVEKYIEDNSTEDIYIIGGSQVYSLFIDKVDAIYLTIIEENYNCDCFFPYIPNTLLLEDVSEKKTATDDKTSEVVNYRFITYKKTNKPCPNEDQYLNLVQNVLEFGNKREDRTETGTISLFGENLKFDISKYIPILTTKRVAFKLTIKELLFFLQGKTHTKVLEEAGVNIWKGNTSRKFLDSCGLFDYEEGELGNLYSFQFRHYGAKYRGHDVNYTGEGVDQLENVINLLKTDPFSRRILISTYDPSEVTKGPLYPCHGLIIQFYVEEIDGQKFLSVHAYSRSADLFIGIPINILSYSLLTYIIASKVDMKPKNLTISMGDSHIYSNHIEQVKEMLSRHPLSPAIVELDPLIKTLDWNDITEEHFSLINYSPRASIKAPMAI